MSDHKSEEGQWLIRPDRILDGMLCVRLPDLNYSHQGWIIQAAYAGVNLNPACEPPSKMYFRCLLAAIH